MKGLITALAALVVLGLALFLYSSPTAPPEKTEDEIAQIQAEVIAFEEDRVDAFEERSANRLLEGWYDHDVFEVSFAERLAGRKETGAFYEELASRWASVEMEWMPGSTVDVISPTVALFQGTARFATTNPAGGSALQNLHIAQFLRKVDGIWKIQLEHASGGVIAGN